MQIFIAIHPGEEKALSDVINPRAHIAYKVDEYGRLLYAQDYSASEGIMILSAAEKFSGQTRNTAAEVLLECRERRYSAVLANLSHPALLDALYSALVSGDVKLAVDEALGTKYPNAWVVVSSSLSGGTFAKRISDAANKFGGGRILLDIEPMRADFTLPAPDGQFRALSPEELSSSIHELSYAHFYSQDLCCSYFCYFSGTTPHAVLFDDAASLRRKLETAAAAGVERAIVSLTDGWELVRQI